MIKAHAELSEMQYFDLFNVDVTESIFMSDGSTSRPDGSLITVSEADGVDNDGNPIYVEKPIPFTRVIKSAIPRLKGFSSFIKYCDLQESFNSPLPVRDEDLEKVDIRKINPKLTMRRPKPPVFKPLKLQKIKKPILKPFKIEDLKPVTPPRNSKALERWNIFTLPRILEKRQRVVARINQYREERFNTRMIKFGLALARQAELRRIHKLNFEKSWARYEARLRRWELQVERYKIGILKRGHNHGWSTENPYRFMTLLRHGESPPGVLTQSYDYNYAAWAANGSKDPPWGMNVYTAPYVVSKEQLGALKTRTFLSEGMWASTEGAFQTVFKELEPKVIRKVYSKLANQKVHIGNLIAERHQTLELLVTNWKRIKDLVLLKKGILKGISKAVVSPRFWANEVLAFKFGVEPLIADIQSAIKVLESGLGDYELVVRTNSTQSFSFDYDMGSFNGKATISYVVKYRIDNVLAKRLDEFGLLDPAQIAWEVTPWSFVVDWLIPVGDWIESLTQTVGLSFKTGTRKIKLVGTWKIKRVSGGVHFLDGNPNGEPQISGSIGTYSGVLTQRQVLTDWPDRDKILHVKSPISWSHGVESLALLVQKLRKT